MRNLTADVWSQGWQDPKLTCFGASMPNNYDGSFLEFWKQQADYAYGHVIDLGCGNGALVWILNEILSSEDRQAKITGVDFANISPFNTLDRREEDFSRVRFIGNSPMEKLPFADNSVDLAVSQFGLEYSNLEESIPEISRVLTAAGQMSFILHDKAGHLAKIARKYIHEYKSLLYESNAHKFVLELDKVAESLEYDDQRMSASAEFQALFAKIKQAIGPFEALMRNYSNDLIPLVTYLRQLDYAVTQAVKPPSQREIPLETLINNAYYIFNQTLERMNDMIHVSLDEAGRQRLASLIKNQGFSIIELRPLLYKGDQNWGTALVAKRFP
jgi:ubiquinone/menaquinone biosynthesis C-methylase UbiE